MWKRYPFIALLVIGQFRSIGQSFTIEGTINVDTGSIELLPEPNTEYYPGPTQVFKTSVKQGHFVFNGSLDYPRAFRVVLRPQYLSGVFFVDPGTQALSCNIDSGRNAPAIVNKTMEEWKAYNASFRSSDEAYRNYRKRFDSLKRSYGVIPGDVAAELGIERDRARGQWDSLLLVYVRKHPDSFVAFWEEAILIDFTGYRKMFDSVYEQFSGRVKDTYAGRVLAKTLRVARLTAIGNTFPLLDLVNLHGQPATVPQPDHSAKYVLVDFWYSHCGACIGQFPELKKMYAEYSPKGFRMIGVSTDSQSFIKSWKAVIKAHALPWPQYRDGNGKWADTLGIKTFPSNFLLDGNGVIVKKDISTEELSLFLSTASF